MSGPGRNSLKRWSSSSSSPQQLWTWLASFGQKLKGIHIGKSAQGSGSPGSQSQLSLSLSSGREGVVRRVNTIMTSYEDLIGIRQVKDAQGQVIQAEIRFGQAQEGRRAAQRELNSLETRLREVRYDLEKTPRGENHYLDLVKREMELIREERVLRDEFERQEKEERDLFGSLSSALRASHEKERAQTEKTKYWSVLGSMIGAVIGIVGATISSRLKMNELKGLVKDMAGNRGEAEERLTGLVSRVNSLLVVLEERVDTLEGFGQIAQVDNGSVSEERFVPSVMLTTSEPVPRNVGTDVLISLSVLTTLLLLLYKIS